VRRDLDGAGKPRSLPATSSASHPQRTRHQTTPRSQLSSPPTNGQAVDVANLLSGLRFSVTAASIAVSRRQLRPVSSFQTDGTSTANTTRGLIDAPMNLSTVHRAVLSNRYRTTIISRRAGGKLAFQLGKFVSGTRPQHFDAPPVRCSLARTGVITFWPLPARIETSDPRRLTPPSRDALPPADHLRFGRPRHAAYIRASGELRTALTWGKLTQAGWDKKKMPGDNESRLKLEP